MFFLRKVGPLLPFFGLSEKLLSGSVGGFGWGAGRRIVLLLATYSHERSGMPPLSLLWLRRENHQTFATMWVARYAPLGVHTPLYVRLPSQCSVSDHFGDPAAAFLRFDRTTGCQSDLPPAAAPVPRQVRGQHRQQLGGDESRGHPSNPVSGGERRKRDRQGGFKTGIVSGKFFVETMERGWTNGPQQC